MLQAKVSELRNSMKTVLLQNQQLKQDLKQSRLRKVRHFIFLCEKVVFSLWAFFSPSFLVSTHLSCCENTKYLCRCSLHLSQVHLGHVSGQ